MLPVATRRCGHKFTTLFHIVPVPYGPDGVGPFFANIFSTGDGQFSNRIGVILEFQDHFGIGIERDGKTVESFQIWIGRKVLR